MSISDRTTSTDGGPLSLIQFAAAGSKATSKLDPPSGGTQHVEDVQHLVLQTKDVATAMVQCFFELRQQRDEAQQQLLLLQGSSPALEGREAAASAYHPAANLSLVSTGSTVRQLEGVRNCTVNTTVDVTVGGASRKVTFGRAVANGTTGYYHCEKVNA